jgi:hypothetical protein
MSNAAIFRRLALAASAALAAAALAGCNTAQTAAPAVAPIAAPAATATTGNIVVDASPVVAQSGNPTAQWAQDSLTAALARLLGGATGAVTVNSVYLGNGGPADPDRMRGVASVNGQQITVRAISVYTPSPNDTALVEQTLHNRVDALSQAFAYRLRRQLQH